MGSNDREVQLAQQERTEKALAERIAKLTAGSVAEKAIAKDTVVRHLRADIASLKRRLRAIDAIELRAKTVAELKAAKAAQPKQKKKKDKAEAAPEGKKDKKKKKEAAAAAAGEAPAKAEG
jgi:hypothetical protein